MAFEQISFLSDEPTYANEHDIFDNIIEPSFRQIIESSNIPSSFLSFRSPVETKPNYCSVLFGSSLLCRIKYSDKSKYIIIPAKYSYLINNTGNITGSKFEKIYIRISIANVDKLHTACSLLPPILSDFVLNLPTSFDCCSLYEQCSDARKCVHQDRLFAVGCTYKKNLSSGRVFYGKNRNID